VKYQKLSPRQNLAMTWWNRPGFEGYDGVICDGSIRSGKTVAMTVGFVMWAMRSFEGQNFAICGKTIESLRRNVTSNLSNWLAGVFSFKEHRSENKIVVTAAGRTNTFYLFGGKDESSAALIQGITLAGILLDEVALMPRSFVEQAVARCSVTGSKLWFNCNPEGPSHWFYLNWVCEAKKLNMLRLHFTMDDNLSLSPEVKARYESLYSGVFYDRFIRGLWVVAEGLIYTMFNKDFHVVPSTPRPYEKYYLSCDYGTINPTSIGLWGLAAGKWYRVREYYFDSRKEGRQRTDEEHYTELEALAGDLHISAVIVDPSAASFIEVIRRHERYRVEKASNAVIDGIRDVATRLQCGDIFFCDCCTDCIREFGLYRWDEKSTTDRPIKENDHSMDDVRYFVHRVYAPDLLRFK
jgi:PBSX family phage terminase large subunit